MILYLVVTVVLVLAALLFLNRPQLIRINAPLPADFPASGFSHAKLERLLTRFVDVKGNVNYEKWHADEADRLALDMYLAGVAMFSPENAAARFASRSDRLAYWIYAYNAYVIRSVLDHWPLESVIEVKAPLEAVTGLGFFYRQRFLFGEKPYSLYAVEHDRILGEFRDPRIHFVLNCGSESCPILRPELPVGEHLESMLTAAAAEFVNDVRNVRVDRSARKIILSPIFRMYENDFLNDLRRRGLDAESGVLAYIAQYVSAPLQADLAAAGEFDVEFSDFDWTLNAQ